MIPRPHQPYRLPLGDLAVVVPDQGRRFTNAQRVDLAAAVLLQAGSYEGPAREMIALLEQRLGVNPAHRRALETSPADVRAEIADKRRRMLDASREAAMRPAPIRDEGFAAKAAKLEGRLQVAQAELEGLKAGDLKKNRKAIKRVENQLRGLADKLADLLNLETTAYQIMGEARDPILRALLRKELVEAKESETAEIAVDEYGARITHRSGEMRGLPSLKYSRGLRAKKLSGLEHAFHSGYLARSKRGAKEEHDLPADRLFRIGEAYGAAYVVIDGGAKHSGEGGGGYRPKAPIPRNVEVGELLADMRSGLTPRQRMALDLICGDGMRLHAAAQMAGAGAPATRRALIEGLRAADEGRAAAVKARQARGETPVGQHVAEVNAILRRVAPGF